MLKDINCIYSSISIEFRVVGSTIVVVEELLYGDDTFSYREGGVKRGSGDGKQIREYDSGKTSGFELLEGSMQLNFIVKVIVG